MWNPELDILDFEGWIAYGIDNGWIAEPTCYHHDAIPVTEDEEALLEEGDDPCIHVLRVWES